ncbi:hypothetical protein KBC99_02460 [Candidatus Saccharibacteria bacterium]|nr:hypothetical protein [Candidatus Saccharibacteria bacterium]
MPAKQLLISQLRGKIILERSNHQMVGTIQDIIFSPQECKLAYYQIKTFFSNQPHYVRADQVSPIGSTLTIQNPDIIGEADDFVRDKKLLDSPCYILNYKVINQTGRKVGTVHDIGVSPLLNSIERIYVRPAWWKRFRQTEFVVVRSNITDVSVVNKTVTILQGEARVQDTVSEAIPA